MAEGSSPMISRAGEHDHDKALDQAGLRRAEKLSVQCEGDGRY